MEFWGAKVESGKKLKVEREEGMIIHVSQATIDLSADGAENGKTENSKVWLYTRVAGETLAIGTVSNTKPTIVVDLNFSSKFKLWHTSTRGSVHFVGHKSALPFIDQPESDSFEEGVDKTEFVQIVSDEELEVDAVSADEETSTGKKNKKKSRKMMQRRRKKAREIKVWSLLFRSLLR